MTDRWQRTPIAEAALSLVIPTFNPGEELSHVISGWYRQLDRRGKAFEILIVAADCGDIALKCLEGLVSELPRLRVLFSAERGLGAALRQGIAAAQYPLLLTSSDDLQFRPEDLTELLAQINKVDVVLAVRRVPAVPALLRGFGWIVSVLARVLVGLRLEARPAWQGWGECRRRWWAWCLFGINVTDPECRLRLYRRAIFGRMPIQAEGDFVQYEILAKANFLGCLLVELLVGNRPTAAAAPRGNHRLGDAWRVLHDPDFGPAQVKSFPW